MATPYQQLFDQIDSIIKTNNEGDITAAVDNALRKAIINSLGEGYLDFGIVIPTSSIPNPDQRVSVIAFTNGIYNNFLNSGIPLEVNNEIARFNWEGVNWEKEVIFDKDEYLDLIYDLQTEIDSNESRIQDLEENQTTGVQVYSNRFDRSDGRSFLPTTGTLLVSYKVADDAVDSDLNGYYHWSGIDYIKDADIMPDNLVLGGDLNANWFKITNLVPEGTIFKDSALLPDKLIVGNFIDIVLYGNEVTEGKANGDTFYVSNVNKNRGGFECLASINR